MNLNLNEWRTTFKIHDDQTVIQLLQIVKIVETKIKKCVQWCTDIGRLNV